MAGVYTASSVTFRSHDNCVVPGTMVSGPPTRAGYRRRYEGEIVTLVTAGGHQLTVTPKHPILTDRGWVEAGLLDVGDDLVCALSGEWSAIGGPDEDHVPSPIEDVVGALGVVESAVFRTVPTTPEDFHGDGGTAEVDVVEIRHDLLGDVLQPGLVHEAAHGRLPGAPAPRSLAGESLPGGGELPAGLGSVDLTPAGLVGGGDVRPALGGGHLRHADPAGLRPGPQTDPGLGEPSLDDRPGDPVVPAEGGGSLPRFVPTGQVSDVRRVDHVGGTVGVGRRFDPPSLEGHPQKFAIMAQLGADLLERLSGAVQLDRLVDKTVREYHGDVLNVETREGWYSANGITVSNCKCTAAPDWGIKGLSILDDDWAGLNVKEGTTKWVDPSTLISEEQVLWDVAALQRSMGPVLDRIGGILAEHGLEYAPNITEAGRMTATFYRGPGRTMGDRVGHLRRSFGRDRDGVFYAEHELFEIAKEYQGKGLSKAINGELEAYYRTIGVQEIRLGANIDVGGYAWARAGYDWDPDPRYRPIETAETVLHRIPVLGEDSLIEWEIMQARINEAKAADDVSLLPTPWELSNIGWEQGAERWAGKIGMMGSDWLGVKKL